MFVGHNGYEKIIISGENCMRMIASLVKLHTVNDLLIKCPHMKVDLLNKRPFQLNAPFE